MEFLLKSGFETIWKGLVSYTSLNASHIQGNGVREFIVDQKDDEAYCFDSQSK